MPRTAEMEAELRLFWRISKEARETARLCPDESDVRELADELNAFGNHINWPTLRNRCLAAAAEIAPPGRAVVHA